MLWREIIAAGNGVFSRPSLKCSRFESSTRTSANDWTLTNPLFHPIIRLKSKLWLSEIKSEKMGKPLPKSILKPRSVGENIPKPNEQSRSLSIVHLGDGVCWDLDKAANPHMVILRTSGSGKTQTLKAIVWEMYQGFSSRFIEAEHIFIIIPYSLYSKSNSSLRPFNLHPVVQNLVWENVIGLLVTPSDRSLLVKRYRISPLNSNGSYV